MLCNLSNQTENCIHNVSLLTNELHTLYYSSRSRFIAESRLEADPLDKAMSALRQMHNIERFATEIYRAQRRIFTEPELLDRLTAAMNNEQEHIDDLLERIIDQGGTHSWLGAAFEVVGKVFGFVTTLLGKSFVFKADIKVEERAVKDYGVFLDTIDFDEKSKKLIAKNLEDEKIHIGRWKDSLDILAKQSV